MKNTLFVLPAIILMSAIPFSRKAAPWAEQKPNSLSPEEKKEGWSLLFDGTTTSGWHTYGKTTALAQWEAKDGAIHLNKAAGKDQGGDLVSNQEYSDFDLKLEWKISPKGNSGVIFYVHEDAAKYDEPYHTGMEMQVLDNDGHSDGKIHKHRAGDLYDLIASSKETVRPVGQWNEVEIQSKNGQLKLFLNGTNVVTTTLWDANWKTMVAGSKFKQWPDFGTFHSGRIDLQDHGNEVWYRNIKIRKL